MIDGYIKLSIMALLPVVVCVVCYLINQRFLKGFGYWHKQILFGLVFGIVAILETEYSVPYLGAGINARDCAAVICGLVFGAPAGIIAGFIGGIERWFAVYWGVGAFTRIACTLGTILSGVFAGILKIYVFENHIPKAIYAFVAGIIAEVTHLMLVFVTHPHDVEAAFLVVKTCSVPMILANAVSAGLAVLIVNIIRKGKKRKYNPSKPDVSQLFQKRILIVVLVGFFITNAFNLYLQITSVESDIKALLMLNIEDAKSSAESMSNNNLIRITNTMAEELNGTHCYDREYLDNLCFVYGVSEVNIINQSGRIFATTNNNYIDFDMNKGQQSKEFFGNLAAYNSYVQAFTRTSYDEDVFMKYAGARLEDKNYLQVGYDSIHFYNDIREEIKIIAKDRHVGISGHIIVAQSDGSVVSDYYGAKDQTLKTCGITEDLSKMEEYKLYKGRIYDEDVYYSFAMSEGYYIIASQPVSEAIHDVEMSLYLTTFLEVLVFAGIFVASFFVIRSTVVDNVVSINKSLYKITSGNLDTVVDVRTNKEFDSLSTGINKTVGRLKEQIKETEERMKKELEYAAEIQRSALPSTFPAFPEREDIDIYASMDPAKEVGGDFYDFYFIDANKLAILIADVSGKGVPASLFMMRAKTIIKSYAEYGIAVNDVFTNANYNLCEGNDAGLFVTAWMGIIDLETGHMTFANAGHNPPLIKKKDGNFEYLRTKPGFVLGGMEGVAYKLQEMDVEPGSEIFIYTDGLTEAQNISKELYGETRLYEAINRYDIGSSEDICRYIKEEVDTFVGEADQFDDLTMLHLKFIKKTFD